MLSIFDELSYSLPPHIIDDDDFYQILKLFFDVLDEQYQFSLNILQTKMVDILYTKYKNNFKKSYYSKREEIFKLHMSEFFSTIENASKDTKFYEKITKTFNSLGIKSFDLKLNEKFNNFLNQEYIISNKNFNSYKGKFIAFIFVFNLISQANLQGFNSDGFIELIENKDEATKKQIPFSYNIESSLYKETFEAFVKPLTHPVGFGYSFTTVLKFLFEDYFFIKITKHLDKCVIKCLQPDGTYIETNILENKILGFEEIVDENTGKKRFWVNYIDKNTNENIKLVLDYDKRIKFYSFDNIEIENLSLADEKQGLVFSKNKENGTLDYFDYHQYFINRQKIVKFKWYVFKNQEDKSYESWVDYEPDNFRVESGKTYNEKFTITAENILDSIKGEFNGRLFQILPETCSLEYDIRIEYESTIRESLSFENSYKWFDYVPRVFGEGCWTQSYLNGETIYYVGEAINPALEPDKWEPEVGEFFITDETPESSIDKVYIGKSENPNKNPSTWETIVGEFSITDFSQFDEKDGMTKHFVGYSENDSLEPPQWENFVGDDIEISNLNIIKDDDSIYFVGRAENERFVPSVWEQGVGDFVISDGVPLVKPNVYDKNDYKIQNFPEIDYLGKDFDSWFKKKPLYNTHIDSNEVIFSKYEKFNQCALAFDILHDTQESNLFKKNDLIPQTWRVGEGWNIGEDYSDSKIKRILNGVESLSDNKTILTIGAFYQNSYDGEIYPTLEIEDDDIEFEIFMSLEVEDDIEMLESFAFVYDLDFKDSYTIRVGDNLIVENFNIDETFKEVLGWYEEISLNEDSHFQKKFLRVGNFNIGDFSLTADGSVKKHINDSGLFVGEFDIRNEHKELANIIGSQIYDTEEYNKNKNYSHNNSLRISNDFIIGNELSNLELENSLKNDLSLDSKQKEFLVQDSNIVGFFNTGVLGLESNEKESTTQYEIFDTTANYIGYNLGKIETGEHYSYEIDDELKINIDYSLSVNEKINILETKEKLDYTIESNLKDGVGFIGDVLDGDFVIGEFSIVGENLENEAEYQIPKNDYMKRNNYIGDFFIGNDFSELELENSLKDGKSLSQYHKIDRINDSNIIGFFSLGKQGVTQNEINLGSNSKFELNLDEVNFIGYKLGEIIHNPDDSYKTYEMEDSLEIDNYYSISNSLKVDYFDIS